jgi:hypothetical protein
MKKTYSESELKGIAQEVFKQYPTSNTVFATVDGNVFLEQNRAEIHAGKKGRVIPFDRPIKKEEAKEASTKADDIIKAIAEVTTIEELEAYKADTRKTVIKAVEDKTAEFEAAKTQE